MLTDERILQLADEHRMTLGMYPPAQLVNVSPTHMGFRRPPGMTLHGEAVMAFARAICAECQTQCDEIRDGEARDADR